MSLISFKQAFLNILSIMMVITSFSVSAIILVSLTTTTTLGSSSQPFQSDSNALVPTQYQYQTPNQYPYQQQLQQPSPYTNPQQQQSPAINNGATAAPATPQYPYQNSYPYQQQPQPQQQQPSQPFNTVGPPATKSSLIVVTHINNTKGGIIAGTSGGNLGPAASSDFTQIVENTYANPDGYTYAYHYMKGSEAGVTVGLQPGAFGIFVMSNNNNKGLNPTNAPSIQSTFDISYSGDCKAVKSITVGTTYGYGTISPGETMTCTLTISPHK